MELQNANGIEKVQDNIEYNILPEEIIIDHETDTVASKKLFARCCANCKNCYRHFYENFCSFNVLSLFLLRLGIAIGLTYILSQYLQHGRIIGFWLFLILLIDIYAYYLTIDMIYKIIHLSIYSTPFSHDEMITAGGNDNDDDDKLDITPIETHKKKNNCMGKIKPYIIMEKIKLCMEKIKQVRLWIGQFIFGKGKYFLPTSSTFEVIGHLFRIRNTISIYLCQMPIEITMIICFVIFSSDMYNIVVEKYLETSKLTRDRKLLVKVFKSFFLLVFPLCYIYFMYKIPIEEFNILTIVFYEAYALLSTSKLLWKYVSVKHYNKEDENEKYVEIYQQQLKHYPICFRKGIKIWRYFVAIFFVTIIAIQFSLWINLSNVNTKCNEKLTKQIWDGCKVKVPFCAKSFLTSSCDCAYFSVTNYTKATLPDGMKEMQSLVKLGIYSSQITELPENFGESYHALKVLRTVKTNLTKLPENIGKCKKLVQLWAVDSYLTRLPESVTELSKLLELRLNGNKIRQLPANLGNMKDLLSLWVYKNELVELPNSIGNLKKMLKISAFNNHITALPSSITNLNLLQFLIIHNNEIVSLPEKFGDLKNLQLLFIWNNRLLALPNSIGNINMIRYVDIRHNFIENLPTTASANWKNMYYFVAGSNPFCIEGTYVFPNKLKRMKMEDVCKSQCAVDCTRSWLAQRNTCEDNDLVYSFAKFYHLPMPNIKPVANGGCYTKDCDYSNGHCPR